MARRDLILDTIENKVKEDSMEARLWAQRLEDLLESCVIKDIIKETITSISWHCISKGPNLHVAKAHLGRISMTLRDVIFKVDHLVRQLFKNLRNLTPHEF
jgi:hypothetical protein